MRAESNGMFTAPRHGYIDTWRCLAVSLVILSHLSSLRNPDAGTSVITAHVGVFIFFFISGFVVSKTCLFELAAIGRFSTQAFYTRRAFRIVPPLLLYVLTCLVLRHLGVIVFDGAQALVALTYMCNINLVACAWLSGHTWSLAFEEQFYLVFPLAFVWIELSHRPRLLLLIGALLLASLPFWFPLTWNGKTGFLVVYGLFGAGYLFAKNESICRSIPYAPALFLLALALTMLPVDQFESQWLSKYYKFAYLLSIPAMVIASSSETFPLRWLFEIRLVKYIGRISYSIYLWQQLFTDLFKTLPLPVHLLLLSGMVLGCAILFELVERPVVHFGRELSGAYIKSRQTRLAVETAPALPGSH